MFLMILLGIFDFCNLCQAEEEEEARKAAEEEAAKNKKVRFQKFRKKLPKT